MYCKKPAYKFTTCNAKPSKFLWNTLLKKPFWMMMIKSIKIKGYSIPLLQTVLQLNRKKSNTHHSARGIQG